MREGNLATSRLEAKPPHRRGCRLAFLYVDTANRRKLTNIGGWTCLRCAMEAAERIVDHLDAVVTTRILWLGELTHKERRAANQWVLRQDDEIGFFAVTREGAKTLVLSERRISRKQQPHRAAVAVELLIDEMLAPAEIVEAALDERMPIRFNAVPGRVTYTSWNDKWRPAAEDRARRPSRGVAIGFVNPDEADAVVRAAGYEPDIPHGEDAPVVANNVRHEIDVRRSGRDERTDSWGRPIKERDVE